MLPFYLTMSVQSTIIACVRLILDDPTYDVHWVDLTSKWVSDASHVELQVVSIPKIGVDERRTTPEGSPEGHYVRERIYGNRSLRVQITCNTSNQNLEESGQELAETICAGFARSDVEALLSAASLGIPAPQGVRVANSRSSHGDIRSIAIAELWFPWSRSQTGGLIGTIGEIVFESDVGVSGSVLE